MTTPLRLAAVAALAAGLFAALPAAAQSVPVPPAPPSAAARAQAAANLAAAAANARVQREAMRAKHNQLTARLKQSFPKQPYPMALLRSMR
jgi:hypothetical protein